jgi:hypothetical protein
MGYAHYDDDSAPPTQLADGFEPPTQQADVSELATSQANALAWSQEDPAQGEELTQYVGEQDWGGEQPTQYFGSDAYQQYPQSTQGQPFAPNGPWNDGARPRMPWYRGTSTLVASGVIVVALAGGGLAYSLTSTTANNPRPSRRHRRPWPSPCPRKTRTRLSLRRHR